MQKNKPYISVTSDIYGLPPQSVSAPLIKGVLYGG